MCRLITTSELEHHTDKELCALFRKVTHDLTKSDPDTAARRNSLASLENINRVMNARRTRPFKPHGF